MTFASKHGIVLNLCYIVLHSPLNDLSIATDDNRKLHCLYLKRV